MVRLFADEYRRRLFELLDSYSPTNTAVLIRGAGRLSDDVYRRRSFDSSGGTRIPPTSIGVAGLVFADEYRRPYSRCWTLNRRRILPTLVASRLFSEKYRRMFSELIDAYSPTNTADAHSSCWTRIWRRITPTLIRFAGRSYADEYRRRLIDLMDAHMPTNTADAYSSGGTLIRRRIPPTSIRVARLVFADEYRRPYSRCWTLIRRRIPPTLIRFDGIVIADENHLRLFDLQDSWSPKNTADAYSIW